MELRSILNSMEAAAAEGAQLMLQAKKILAQCKSGARDVVTQYDTQVQALLMERLAAAVPGAEFFAEELKAQGGPYAEKLFIIDPIDGTMNFVKGLQTSCISIAYAERGEVKAAAVYNPYLNEMFAALAGEGAFLNGERLQTPDVPLEESVVAFGTAPYNPELAEESFRLAKLAFDHSLDVRRGGSAALDLCSVAAGRVGLYFELRLSYWDYAAGAFIAKQAGAVCLQPDGTALATDGTRPPVLAGSPTAVAAFRKLMTEKR